MRRSPRLLSAVRAYRCLPPLLSVGAALLAACGSDAGSDASPAPAGGTAQGTQNAGTGGNGTQPASTVISLPVQLTALPAAWDKSGSTLDPTLMYVQVGDPAPVFTDTTGKATVKWTNSTPVAASNCTTNAQNVRTCSLTIANIETADYSIGMLVKVSDTRTSFSGAAWTSLSTGVAQATLTGLRGADPKAASPSPIFVMTSDGADQLATWSGVAKVDLIANGAMLGLILDKSMQPVKGAQLSTGDSSLQLVYAANDFSGPATPGASATLPYFVVTPHSAKVVKSTGWTLSAPSPATAKWSVPLVGSAPQYLVMIPFLGQ